MNYGEFKQLIADYLHRTDLDDKIPDFVEFGRTMMNRDLRVREMVASEPLTPTTNPFSAPTGFLESRELYHNRNGNRVSLTLVGRGQLAFYSSSNIVQTNPRFYSVDGLQIETAPGGVDIEFTMLFYKQIDQLVNDSDTNIILDVYPKVWLYAAMIEAHSYVQDLDLMNTSQQMYLAEMQTANQRAKEAESGAALQMQGASQWV